MLNLWLKVVKASLRQQIFRDGKLFSGSGRPTTLPDPTKKKQLQRKLDKKLAEMSDDRRTKPKK